MTNVVKTGELYPIASEENLPPGFTRTLTRARWTGEFRAPKAGEWYLSGAVVEAWQVAPNDLVTPFHIAELVHGRVVFD